MAYYVTSFLNQSHRFLLHHVKFHFCPQLLWMHKNLVFFPYIHLRNLQNTILCPLTFDRLFALLFFWRAFVRADDPFCHSFLHHVFVLIGMEEIEMT